MSSNPNLFDRKLLAGRRARIARSAHIADFLHETSAHDIADRLSLIRRDFPVAVDLGSHSGQAARSLSNLSNVGTIIRTDTCMDMLNDKTYLSICCDEEILPFAPHSLDLVCSVLALHFVNDLPGALSQIFRALKPDGLFIAALFGAGTLAELGHSFMEAEIEVYGGASPRLIPMADVREMGGLLQRAGFALPVADVETVKVRYNSPAQLIRDIRLMGATNVLVERSRRPVSRKVLSRMFEIYREKFADSDGRIRATFEVLNITGWHPHESQQKPLAPGSAKMKLADVLEKADNGSDQKSDPSVQD